MRIFVTTVVLTLGLVGCPGQEPGSGPVNTCESAGQQCRLGGGQLGVCTAKADQELECTSQH